MDKTVCFIRCDFYHNKKHFKNKERNREIKTVGIRSSGYSGRNPEYPVSPGRNLGLSLGSHTLAH